MLKGMIVGFCMLMLGCEAMEETFIEEVHKNPLGDLRKIVTSLQGHERFLGEKFANLYLDTSSQDSRRTVFTKLGNEGEILYQTAEFVARSYFSEMQRDMFSVDKAVTAVQWLERVHNDGIFFRKQGILQDGDTVEDLLLSAKQILAERKDFERKLNGSEEDLLDLIKIADK